MQMKPNLPNNLATPERDQLKYLLAQVAASKLSGDGFELPVTDGERFAFDNAITMMRSLQPFVSRVPRYGLVYNSRPTFMTDDLVDSLKKEAASFRPVARTLRHDDDSQFLYQSDDPSAANLLSEKLAESSEVLELVRSVAGSVSCSYVTNYIYYDRVGQCSRPHVDNHFTTITAMIGLEHSSEGSKRSASVAYWNSSPRLDYQLAPGEISVFFGTCALHGRTPVVHGERVISLLLSFVPTGDDGVAFS